MKYYSIKFNGERKEKSSNSNRTVFRQVKHKKIYINNKWMNNKKSRPRNKYNNNKKNKKEREKRMIIRSGNSGGLSARSLRRSGGKTI